MAGYISIIRTARKDYECNKCGQTIKKGTEYESYQVTSPWYMTRSKYHLRC